MLRYELKKQIFRKNFLLFFSVCVLIFLLQCYTFYSSYINGGIVYGLDFIKVTTNIMFLLTLPLFNIIESAYAISLEFNYQTIEIYFFDNIGRGKFFLIKLTSIFIKSLFVLLFFWILTIIIANEFGLDIYFIDNEKLRCVEISERIFTIFCYTIFINLFLISFVLLLSYAILNNSFLVSSFAIIFYSILWIIYSVSKFHIVESLFYPISAFIKESNFQYYFINFLISLVLLFFISLIFNLLGYFIWTRKDIR